MTEEHKLDLMKKFKELNVAEYTTKYGDYYGLMFAGAEEATKELEEKISVLLSCKNCPENKGGLICQKEYENKCLAQKIQFIKELQEENLKLEAKVRTLEIEQNYCLPNCSKIADLENKLSNVSYQLEGREVELKELNKKLSQAEADYDKMFWQKNEIISNLKVQIEKMKCCANCKHSRTEYEHCKTNKHEKWEIKENDSEEV